MSCERTVKIVLHGYLKDLYKDEINLSGHNVAELINGMCKTTKAFNTELNSPKHMISIVGFESKESLYEPLPDNLKELHLTPALFGGKKGGFFQIVLGVVAVAVGLYLAPVGASIFSLTGVSGFLFNTGLSLLLGGLLSMLSPQPKTASSGSEAVDPEASKYLGATQNTVKIGTRIPIMYGENKHSGHYISFDVDAKDVAL